MKRLETRLKRLGLAAVLAGTVAAGLAIAEEPVRHGRDSAQKATAGEHADCPNKGGRQDGLGGRRPPRFEDLDTNGDGKLSQAEAADIPPVRDEGFDTFDDNGDGYLTQDELPPPPQHGEGPGGGRRPPRFEDLDTNGDGKLSPEEAADIPPVRDDGFDTFDDNGDGYLTQDELPPPPGRGEGGPEGGKRPPSFDEADTNGDGKLSASEAAVIPPVQHEGFTALDENHDGFLTKDEVPPPPGRGGDGPQARGGRPEGGKQAYLYGDRRAPVPDRSEQPRREAR